MDKKLKLKMELEAKILEEENKIKQMDDRINQFQLEEIKIMKRLNSVENIEKSLLKDTTNKRNSNIIPNRLDGVYFSLNK